MEPFHEAMPSRGSPPNVKEPLLPLSDQAATHYQRSLPRRNRPSSLTTFSPESASQIDYNKYERSEALPRAHSYSSLAVKRASPQKQQVSKDMSNNHARKRVQSEKSLYQKKDKSKSSSPRKSQYLRQKDRRLSDNSSFYPVGSRESDLFRLDNSDSE